MSWNKLMSFIVYDKALGNEVGDQDGESSYTYALIWKVKLYNPHHCKAANDVKISIFYYGIWMVGKQYVKLFYLWNMNILWVGGGKKEYEAKKNFLANTIKVAKPRDCSWGEWRFYKSQL